MAENPKLFFDPECPVCSSFVKLLRKKAQIESVEFIPMDPQEAEEAESFRLEIGSENYSGKEAVNKLVELLPSVKNYFWMLPPSYRHQAVYRTWRIGVWFRKIWFKIFGRKDCNCR